MSKDKKTATPEEQPLAARETPLPPALLDAMTGDGDTGFEDTDRNDYAIPFLTILQPLSKVISDGTREDLRAGMFYDTVNDVGYSGKDGLNFIPSYYRRVGTLWVPRDEGGGFRGLVSVDKLDEALAECTQDDRNNFVTPEGLHLRDTREWYGLIVSSSEPTPVVLSLSSTQLRKSKRWLTLAQGLRHQGKPLKLWSQVYHLTTVPEKNDKGAWHGLEVKHVGPVSSIELFEAAAQFRELVASGAVNVNREAGDAAREEAF